MMGPRKIYVNGTALRRGIAGRWIGKINKHTVSFRPNKGRGKRWQVWLQHGLEPLGLANTFTEGLALVIKETNDGRSKA